MERLKNSSTALAWILVLVLAIYYGFLQNISIVYTHLFYVLIIITGFRKARLAIPAAIFLATVHVALESMKHPDLLSAALMRGLIMIFVGVVLSNLLLKKERMEEIEYLSYHDQLTGLHNRRYFDEMSDAYRTAKNYPLALIIFDVNGLKLANDAFGHEVGDKLLQKVAWHLNQNKRPVDLLARIGGDEFVMIMPGVNKEQASKKIQTMVEAMKKEKVESVCLSVSYGMAVAEDASFILSKMFKKAENVMYANKLIESDSIRYRMIDLAMKTLFEKDSREREHAERVSELCVKIAFAMGLSMDKTAEMRTAGLLHDIGKISIDDQILNKAEPPTEREWQILKKHSETGYRILCSASPFAHLSKYVLHHHEWWDGSGYPDGLSGEDIPLESRIIAVADAWDALTNDYEYRKALDPEVVTGELLEHSGTQFDPEIIRIFFEKELYRI